MHYPRFSPRAWFWALTLAAFLWAYAGSRTVPAAGAAVMRSAQGIIAEPVHLLLVPGSWIVTSVQGGITSAIRNITATRQDTETLASLSEKNKKLQDDVSLRDGQIQMLSEQIRNLQGRALVGIPPADLVRAYITGRNVGAGSSTLNIDKGTADGVIPGMPVIAGENHIVGRVLSAGPKTALVRLITDPNSTVQAMIVRQVDGGTKRLLKTPCLVKGSGNGEFRTSTVKTLDADIEKGDILQLLDNEWPAKLQYFILGVVYDVGLNPNQMLRYEVRTRANINDIQFVEVLTKW